ncbi:MAG: carboxypeptidase-like regulatory domain-containing protein [Chitinophagaceae bacterium]
MTKFLLRLKTIFFFLSLVLLCNPGTGQIIISGTVYDSTKLYVVPGVIVKSTGGGGTITDSLGRYHINTAEKDSISFYYANKPTQKFPVKSISNYNDFDISLQVRVFEKYKLLKEVKIFTKNYRQDSAENRLTYSKIFDYQKPGLRSNFTPGTPPGLDINELINIFRFRRNKQNLAFQKRLMEEEEDKYVNYKFNNTLLKRVTGLTGILLDKYKITYKPSYEFIITATELEFYEYILNTADRFKKQEGLN